MPRSKSSTTQPLSQTQRLESGYSDRFLWRGRPMCAVRISDDLDEHGQLKSKAVRIHLEDSDGRTLCGFLPQYVVDRNVVTGWPDCNDCITKTETKPSWQA